MNEKSTSGTLDNSFDNRNYSDGVSLEKKKSDEKEFVFPEGYAENIDQETIGEGYARKYFDNRDLSDNELTKYSDPKKIMEYLILAADPKAIDLMGDIFKKTKEYISGVSEKEREEILSGFKWLLGTYCYSLNISDSESKKVMQKIPKEFKSKYVIGFIKKETVSTDSAVNKKVLDRFFDVTNVFLYAPNDKKEKKY